MSIVRVWQLYSAVFRKELTFLVRYPVDTVGKFVTTYLMFVAIFMGAQSIAPNALGRQLGALIVGYFLWTTAIYASSGLALSITSEAQWGTLEQLFSSPHGFGRVAGAMIVSLVVISLLWGSAILALLLLTTGESLNLDVGTVLVLVVLTLGTTIGVGFALGGLALLYKRVSSLINLATTVYIGLIALPVGDSLFLRLPPLSLGSHLLQLTLVEGRGFLDLPAADVGLLAIKAVAYILLGYGLFLIAVSRAKRLGVLGQY